MNVTALFKLRAWQTLDEAADLLSHMTEETVTKADLLQAVLAGELRMSVFLPTGTLADCWDLNQHRPPYSLEHGDPDDDDSSHPPDGDDGDPPTGIGLLEEVWDLRMVPPAARQVENWCNELRGLPLVAIPGPYGVVVERSGTVCRLRAGGASYSSPSSAVPAGSKPVVRTPELLAFAQKLLPAAPLDKPLGETEKRSLLIIIGACLQLAKKANPNIDRFQPFKAAKHILTAAEAMGLEISENTIAKYLKLANEEVLPSENE